MHYQTPEKKRTYREILSVKFCKLNGLPRRTDLTSNDRRELVRKGEAEKRLNSGHKLHAAGLVKQRT